jgi:hypothetical protein
MILEAREKVLESKPNCQCLTRKNRNNKYLQGELGLTHFSLAIDVVEPCSECPMICDNGLLGPLVGVVPLLQRVLKEDHLLRRSDVDFAPLSIE